jgi:hypothetical protein
MRGQPLGAPKPLDLFAYRISLFSLIPGLGLVLGLVALVLAGFAWSGHLLHPEGRRRGPVLAAAILGCATMIANLIGVALIIRGLAPGGEP